MNFERIRWLKNVHAGKDAFLMCNGPSLKKVNFSRVDPSRFILFGLNKIHLGFNIGIPVPHYTTVVNRKVIRHLFEDPKFSFNTLILSHRAGLITPESENIFYVNTDPSQLNRFSYECDVGVHEGWTVTHAALQLIHFMGIRRCIIVGMDHQFDTDPLRANQSEIKRGSDSDHFVPDYFSDGQDWDLPDLVNSEISYHAAKIAYEKSGGLVIDATEGGHCQVFLKASLNTCLDLFARLEQ